jgi:hypothetical protein
MAGRRVLRTKPRMRPRLETASLREDYLNQVQRDFLSRCRLNGINTPSEVARSGLQTSFDYHRLTLVIAPPM